MRITVLLYLNITGLIVFPKIKNNIGILIHVPLLKQREKEEY